MSGSSQREEEASCGTGGATKIVFVVNVGGWLVTIQV